MLLYRFGCSIYKNLSSDENLATTQDKLTNTKYYPEKRSDYTYSIDAPPPPPRALNPDLVCDLATRQSHQLTNEHAYLPSIVTVGAQEGLNIITDKYTDSGI